MPPGRRAHVQSRSDGAGPVCTRADSAAEAAGKARTAAARKNGAHLSRRLTQAVSQRVAGLSRRIHSPRLEGGGQATARATLPPSLIWRAAGAGRSGGRERDGAAAHTGRAGSRGNAARGGAKPHPQVKPPGIKAFTGTPPARSARRLPLDRKSSAEAFTRRGCAGPEVMRLIVR